MARNVGTSIENNFVNGLVTEATGLNFPENAVTDCINVDFDPIGAVGRRKGIDLEPGFQTVPISSDTAEAWVEYLWKGVGGEGQRNFLVQQVGRTVHFYQNTSGATISEHYLGSINIGTYALASGSIIDENFCQFSAGLGYLIIVHPYCIPFFVTFNPSTSSFSTSQISIQTRDFKGLEPLGVPRQGTMDATHHYNLKNQGWSESHILGWYQKIGNYPSDFDVWWLYKSPDAFGAEQFLVDTAVAGGIVDNVNRGNSPAPRGSLILDEFYQDRSVSGVTGLPIVTAGANRPSTTAFHAGRVFYSGVNIEEYTSKIYFTQIIETTSQFAKCYQENDPTSQFSPDLLPTDGGVIAIPDAGRIYKLWSTNNSLLVFASQGVWEITGSQGIGFSATDYTVKRISSAPCDSALSFVDVDGMPIWWGIDDIYVALSDTRLGGIAVQSLTEEKIKTFYNEIPDSSRLYAKGAYNNRERIVQWVYKSTQAPSSNTRQEYDSILCLNTRTKAFSPWRIAPGPAVVRGVTTLQGQGLEETEELVTVGGATVTADGVAVFISSFAPNLLTSQFKYATRLTTNHLTYSQADEENKRDWSSLVVGGAPFESFFVAGYRVRGDGMRDQQSNYLMIYGETEVSSRFLIRGIWDYAIQPVVVRWSVPQTIFITNKNYKYGGRRIKIRGHGKVLQYRVDNYEDSDFRIIGWSSLDSANSGA